MRCNPLIFASFFKDHAYWASQFAVEKENQCNILSLETSPFEVEE